MRVSGGQGKGGGARNNVGAIMSGAAARTGKERI